MPCSNRPARHVRCLRSVCRREPAAAIGPGGWLRSYFKFEVSNPKFHIGRDFRNHQQPQNHGTIMTYERFEDLPGWQKAADLYEQTEELLETETFKATRGFRDQLDRAALSVSNNIAEGFESGTTNELLAFIYIARGSAGEVRSMLCLKERFAKKAGWP